MLDNFKDLIKNYEYSEQDMQLAAYYHIINGEDDWVINIFSEFKEKYPENTDVYAYV